MEFATGALGTLLPKLGQLLLGEYNLHRGAKKNIKFLREELQSIQAALHGIGEVPLDQLSEPVKIWANQARELSYDMEDIVDTFLVRIQGPDPLRKKGYKKFFKKMSDMVTKAKTQHEIGKDINDIKERVKEVAARRQRYKLEDITSAKTTGLDPRVASLYTKVADLVGIDKAREKLILRLTKGDDDVVASKQRIVSVVGLGGLGKTTLAKAVYDKLKEQFDCTAFVPVGRNPDLKKVLKDILIDLHNHFNLDILDERQLINKLQEFLENKRYFIVIDDIWDTRSWGIIKLALADNNGGSRVLITTRTHEVATKAGGLYELQRLSYDNCRKLFFARIYGGKNKSSNHQPDEPDEMSDKILRKCEGVPLAIITMASLLEGKPREEWSEVHRSISFGNKENQQPASTMKVLSLSYYDLPPHLPTCLLHLTVFPEDYFIEKNPLIWMWIAEDFVHKEQGRSSFEIGEEYFNQLVNRSLIQLVEKWDYQEFVVHDMVLDLIRSISSEENFVTLLLYKNNEVALLPSATQVRVRRLALQRSNRVLKKQGKASRTFSTMQEHKIFTMAKSRLGKLNIRK
ncbi:hypothetical protein HU200_034751 [Digitaria exilis]|uniref:Uncharacterized protein n=1 Tax=Digitaria exilis TaxID=1010633 RepID=A0A835BK49_9POAL|nr:hypothetical protein HU200_034751 [Digitaria exilis]